MSAAALLYGCLLLATSDGTAETRYAVLIGSNLGSAGETPLRYAIRDTERFAQVLGDVGHFAEDNIVVLKDPSADRLRSVLARTNARIRNEIQPNGSSMLLVYYSGHADVQALHLNGTKLPWQELRNLTSGSAASTRILVVDACRSGSATRVKGTRLDQPFALPESETQLAEGFVMLSSAAAGEDAQESDQIEGSFFTSHLVTALRGIGDHNADGKVTLAEAYDYTAHRTIASSATTMGGVQHPTYAYEIRGRADLVLTRPGFAKNMSSLSFAEPGLYLFYRGGSGGRLEFEANIQKSGTQVSLRPGAYFVQRRLPDRYQEGNIQVEASTTQDLDLSGFRAIEYSQLVRKGGMQRLTVGALLGAEILSPLVTGYSPNFAGNLTLSADLNPLTIDIKGQVGYSDSVGEEITGRLVSAALLVGVRKVFDFDLVSVSGGVRLGGICLWQSFVTQRIAPDRTRLIPALETVARLDANLPWGVIAALEGGLRVSYLQVKTGPASSQLQTPVQPEISIGLGKQF